MAPGQYEAWDRVWEVKRQFEKEYPRIKYGQYSSGISKVYLQTVEVPEGEDEDYCIKVSLMHSLPAHLKFPEKYQGVRVYAKVEDPTTAE